MFLPRPLRPHPATPSVALALAATLAACSAAEPTPPPALGMNDVSVLVPLDVAAGWLPADASGARGVLLPKAAFEAVPKFGVTAPEGIEYPRMRVVAARFDGCFRYPGKPDCEAQIRLVFQPLHDDGSARDSALHVFYRLEDGAFREVVKALRSLRKEAPEASVEDALRVHPALAAQGANGRYATELRALILAHAGEANLIRETFFLRAPPKQETWFFGGVAPKEGKYKALDIVGVGASNQRVIRPVTAGGYLYDVLPAPTEPEDGNALLDSAKLDGLPDEARTAAYASYVRLQNPKNYGPDDLPCAGCHVATVVTTHLEARWPALATAAAADRFASPRNLSLTGGSAEQPSSLRAFGWFGREPMIAHRIVNETAEVLDDLARRYPD